MWLDLCPKLRRRTLRTAGALGPGQKTYWSWPGIADAPTIEVVGGDGAFTIIPRTLSAAGDGGATKYTWSQVRVVVTKRGMTCPRCGAGCQALVYNNDAWGCRQCAGYRYRCQYQPSPIEKRRAILRQLSRVDPLSLKAYELEHKLRRINRAIVQRAKNVRNRITHPDRRGRPRAHSS
jgi:hypothetical protein